MAKPILISGIQPTGKLHIGNYLGALKNFVELQNSGKYDCYFFIADLHSLTEDFNPADKSKQILDLTADYLVAGLNSQKSVIFLQSQVPAHSELAVILNNFTPVGEAERMVQFKEKSKQQRENINIGLFDYPILQAADILLYDTNYVPVGEDQKQHLELTRTLARKFNNRFGKVFTEPEALLTNSSRIMDLRTPGKKMSKSDPSGCVFLDDGFTDIRAKIQRATTDSHVSVEYIPVNRPGMANLILIYSALSGKTPKEIEKQFENKGYADFKNDLAETIIKAFAPFQKKKKEILKDPVKIKKILSIGQKVADDVASKKLLEVKKKIGLTL